MQSSACTPARLSGLLMGSETVNRLPVLLVRARSATNGALLAESYSTVDGQFMLTLPLAGSAVADFHLPIVVEVLDGNQVLLGESQLEIAPGEQTGLTFSLTNASDLVPANTPALAPPLVDADAASMLRKHVQDFVSRGELEMNRLFLNWRTPFVRWSGLVG